MTGRLYFLGLPIEGGAKVIGRLADPLAVGEIAMAKFLEISTDVYDIHLIFLLIYTTRWCVLSFMVYVRRIIKKGV